MTQLLVSVRNAEEAAAALRGGAGLIDVKEPQRGPLGAADLSVIQDVATAVDGALPVSVALGELLEVDSSLVQSMRSWPPAIRYAKFGLAGCVARQSWISLWQARLAALPAHVSPVAVAYVDWQVAKAPHPEEVLTAGIELGCRAFLLDTFDKRAGSCATAATTSQLHVWISAAQSAGLLTVLAGRLSAQEIELLRPLQPDFFGVRGAACRDGRLGELCEDRVRELADLLHENRPVVALKTRSDRQNRQPAMDGKSSSA